MNEVFFGNLSGISGKNLKTITLAWYGVKTGKKSTLMWWWQYVIVKMIVTNF